METRPTILSLRNQGMPIAQIAKKLNISEFMVSKRLQDLRHGISHAPYERSICGNCANMTCEWMQKHPKPVPGWKATPSKIYADGWCVTHCPKFKAFKECRGKGEL
jgi:hypothetical protein